jgi:hypothetical protein
LFLNPSLSMTAYRTKRAEVISLNTCFKRMPNVQVYRTHIWRVISRTLFLNVRFTEQCLLATCFKSKLHVIEREREREKHLVLQEKKTYFH